MSYSGFEPTRLQVECHSHHTGWATEGIVMVGMASIQRRYHNFHKPNGNYCPLFLLGADLQRKLNGPTTTRKDE
ncbi:hypothetical protein TNCV_497771 [Trichonephila clavipes]|nr:hypothetical protein TNCV_497771 [Trichonephila clavipes]